MGTRDIMSRILCPPFPTNDERDQPDTFLCLGMNHYAQSSQAPRGHPQQAPPPAGNSAMTGAAFFVDQKKGEINELKQVCSSHNRGLHDNLLNVNNCCLCARCSYSPVVVMQHATFVEILTSRRTALDCPEKRSGKLNTAAESTRKKSVAAEFFV